MMKFICLLSLLIGTFGQIVPDVPRLDGRIVGGYPTTIDKFPYQISLQYGGVHVCGGSIISKKYVVTAAHCVEGTVAGYTVRAGTSTQGYGGSVHVVYSIASHANFGELDYNNDVALIRIVDSFEFGTNVQPVELARASYVAVEGDVSVVTGWGNTQEGGSAPSQLQAVEVPIVNLGQCNSSYGGTVYDTMVCAGVTEGGRDACQGDSGGPLVVDGLLVGIVSWGYGCARPFLPGVYTSVGYYRTWINANIALQE